MLPLYVWEFQTTLRALWSGILLVAALPWELVIMGFIALVVLVWTVLFWQRDQV